MAKSLEGNPIKPANAKIEYTDKMLEELANCSDPEDGYMHFIQNYGYIKHPSRGMILYEPFDYQHKLLHVYHNYRFSISMVGRQMGKCLDGSTKITVRNKNTGEIKEVSIEDFHYDNLDDL